MPSLLSVRPMLHDVGSGDAGDGLGVWETVIFVVLAAAFFVGMRLNAARRERRQREADEDA